MPVPLSVGNILKCMIVTQDAGQVGLNTAHYKVLSVGVPAANDSDVAIAFDAAVGPRTIALINDNANYLGSTCQIIGPSNVQVFQASLAGAGAGTAGATSLPKQVSGLGKWFTSLAGRRYRGRIYIPFPATADDTGDGFPTAGYITRVSALLSSIFNLTAIANGGRTAGIQLQLYHRDTLDTTLITGGAPVSEWATQRRRGAFGRGNIPPI